MNHWQGLSTSLLLWLLSTGAALGDAVSDLPEPWQDRLLPVLDSDISGAEPLMQQALNAARAEIAALLTASEPNPEARPQAASASESQDQALAQAYGRLGGLLLLLEVEAQADACLRNAMTLQPGEFRWPYYAGYLAMLAGNLERAVNDLETARAINADYPTLYVRLGKVWLDRGELAKARAVLESVQDVPELTSPVNYYLGQVALLEHRPEQAVERLTRALEANPDATEVHYPLAQAYRALGDAQLAREHLAQFQLRAPEITDPLLEQLQRANPRSLPAFQRGIHAVINGEYASAAAEFATGLESDPDNVAARISYARVLYLTGDPEAAAKQLSKALEIQPEHAFGQFMQGVLRQQQGDLTAAEAAYRRALELEPQQAGASFHLANLHFRAGRFDDAAKGYRQVLAADDSVAPARLLALVAQRRAGENQAAILAAVDDLVATYPQDMQLRYGLARLLAAADDPQLRDPQRALHLAADLVGQQTIPAHRRLFALAQAAAGRFDAAIETQRGLLAMPSWMLAPRELEQMQSELHAYQAKQLPHPAWPGDDPLLSPPPFDARRTFRDYPAAKPY